jgi:hypothetical protein
MPLGMNAVKGELHRNSGPSMDPENIGESRAEKGDRNHANRFFGTAIGFFACGDTDFYIPETIKLYRCHLSYCHRYSRIDPMMD